MWVVGREKVEDEVEKWRLEIKGTYFVNAENIWCLQL